MRLEPTERPWPRWRDLRAAYDTPMLVNAAVAWLFAITGPLALMVAVASEARVAQAELASWIFGAYGFGGMLSIVASALYRQPIGIAWSIPAVLVAAPALTTMRMSEVVGAYMVAGLIMIVLGVTGWAGRVMRYVPMSIVMGMVSGVFLPFGIRIVTGVDESIAIAAPAVLAYFVAAAVPAIGRFLPPVLAALVAGSVAVVVSGQLSMHAPLTLSLVSPQLFVPELSTRALIELVIPLLVTVVGIHNPQGFAILAAARYRPPVNALTTLCGIGSLLFALCGAVPTCVAGPSNAIMCSSGRPEQRYVSGMCFGALMLAFGLLAPIATQVSLALPLVLIAVLGGLAMLRALQSWLVAAFGGPLSFGALAAFLVAMSGISVWHIGAPFWALVAGVTASWLLEREALEKAWRE